MSRAVLSPAVLSGTAAPPPSKSAAHRAILCAALAQGKSILSPIGSSADMQATIGCIKALGAKVKQDGEILTVSGPLCSPKGAVTLSCIESGSTLRFLIPIVGALGISAVFTGCGRLPQRPLGIYLDLLPQHGLSCKSTGGLPLTVSGRLLPGVYSLPGDVSSQFITGLLFALPLLSGESEIRLTSPLQSAAYVQMTCDMLKQFGIAVIPQENGWRVPGGQQYRARQLSVERDWSQAAFLLAAGALGGSVLLSGLNPQSAQGDRAIEPLLRLFGAKLVWQGGILTAQPGPLAGAEIDVGQIPDLAPILAVMGFFAQGRTRLYNAARLRLKESDRLAAMAQMAKALGVRAEQTADSLTLWGGTVSGGTVSGCSDHRIVMAAAIAALRAEGPVTVTDAQAVQKSWPEFFSVYQSLGGNADVIVG
ncbi:MAG: 3-phosphoshikimate 1-carboxyvinyltransferase [Oscillospiraceae bacterium]|nr:3-phosphoshikimate 1-carboxyvinyltransferase [Oscillospiraceae bacterium]